MDNYDLYDWLTQPKIPAANPVKNLKLVELESQELLKRPDVNALSPKQKALSTSFDVSKNEKAIKLRQLADAMMKDIDAKLNPAIANQRTTARRADIIASMRSEGRCLQLIQTWLYRLADAWDAGAVPKVLQGISTKKVLEYFAQMLASNYCSTSKDYDEKDIAEIWDMNSSYHDSWRRTLANSGIYNAHATLNACFELKSLGDGASISPKEFEIETLQREIIGLKIDGYFPTPPNVAARVLELANLKPWMRVLETSAGSGHLADLITKNYPGIELDCCEVSFRLRKLLKLKGHKIYAENFLTEVDPHCSSWDAIVQNPPFENLQDIDFVCHAYACLKPDGKLTSIMSVSWTFRQDKKAVEFRDWVKHVNGYWEELPDGAFYASDRPTGVKTGILVIIK